MKTVAEFQAELDAIANKNGKGGSKADVVTLAGFILARFKELEDAGNNDPIVISLKADLEEAKGLVAKAKETFEQDTKTIEALKADLETATQVANDAVAKFNTSASEKTKSLTTKVGGKVYLINHGVNLNGKDYTAEQLSEDGEAVATLAEMQSTAVTLKGDK